MTLEERIGACLAVGFPGTEATPALVAHLRKLHLQAVVLFARNLVSAAQTAQLLRDLNARVGWPLLVLMDHEGGRVVRLRRDLTPFPSAQAMGQRGEAGVVEAQGEVEARELSGLGIHVNLAPCVDVIAAGSDPVIGDRSYGTDASRVSALAAARIRGLQAHGVAACAKHFPGLGAVTRDPHRELPTIPLDWEAMRAVHLPPFHAAIAAGVATIMSSHVCYPALGDPPGLPATFSRRLIAGCLRRELGFDGAILSDDLTMGALTGFGAMGELAVRAAAAGHDLLLICDDLAAQEEAFSGLAAAYRSGRLPADGLEAGVARIRRLRGTFLPHP